VLQSTSTSPAPQLSSARGSPVPAPRMLVKQRQGATGLTRPTPTLGHEGIRRRLALPTMAWPRLRASSVADRCRFRGPGHTGPRESFHGRSAGKTPPATPGLAGRGANPGHRGRGGTCHRILHRPGRRVRGGQLRVRHKRLGSQSTKPGPRVPARFGATGTAADRGPEVLIGADGVRSTCQKPDRPGSHRWLGPRD